MDISVLDFGFACALMALGIGTDVALATVARASQLKTARTVFIWVLGVSLTHTLFPMLGYLMTYFSVQVVPFLTPLIGLFAALCIFWFLHNEFKSLNSAEVSDENHASGDNQRLLISLGLILAVSWDALWSGPAKSAQVIGWPELLVWMSFLLVGAAVSTLALSSIVFARVIEPLLLRRRNMHLSILWLQYSVVGYFGYLALFRYTFNADIPWYVIVLISLSVTGGLMLNALTRECRFKAQ